MVTKPNGEVFKFQQSESGLHYLDTECIKSDNKNEENVLVGNTVVQNHKNYTKNYYQHPLRARELQITMG